MPFRHPGGISSGDAPVQQPQRRVARKQVLCRGIGVGEPTVAVDEQAFLISGLSMRP